MHAIYENENNEITKIIQNKAKYQKVMLLYDENVSNIQIAEIYNSIKDFCVYNQCELSKVTDEIYNGYKVVIYLCGATNFLKLNIRREEFVNIYYPTDGMFLPAFLNENSVKNLANDYVVINNSTIDIGVVSSLTFNSFFSYFKNILSMQKSYENLNFKDEKITQSNLFKILNENNDGMFFLDIDVLKKCSISYSEILIIDLILIDAFLIFISGIKTGTFTMVDIYKIAKDDIKEIDKFYKLYNSDIFYNLIKLNYNCLYNFCIKTKEKILEYVSFYGIDISLVESLMERVKKYSKEDDFILAYLYLFNVFGT